MERIILKNIERKAGGVVVVKFNGNKEATLNTKWQAQEVDYLEKDVGIGGSVEVEIQQKGQYVNITAVNFSSAQKNENYSDDKEEETKGTQEKWRNPDEMQAIEIVKCATELTLGKSSEINTKEQMGRLLCDAVEELTGAYKLALSNLKAL